MLKFPYGLSDFEVVSGEGYFYVDRSDHIRRLEETGRHLLFLRPRRFGKSLLLSMLQNYYDLAKADDFERLFGHLAVGRDPTSLHNRYFVFKLDLSAVSPAGDVHAVERALHNYINEQIVRFGLYYQDWLSIDINVNPLDAFASFQSLLTAISQTPHKLYVLIDEYDNFANELLMGQREPGPQRYEAIVHGEGCLKAFFKVIKSAAAGQGLDRTLYFLKRFQTGCAYPDNMLDSNLAMDRDKIAAISRLPQGEGVIAQALAEAQPLVITRLADRFGVQDMLYAAKDQDFMVSLLYYFGVLTLTGHHNAIGRPILHIPNLVVQQLYVERLNEVWLPPTGLPLARQVAQDFYQSGDLQPVCEFVEQHYFRALDNRDYRWANEMTAKLVFLTLLFDNMLYITDSEPALERDYADTTMIIRPDMRPYKLLDFLFEFKYIGLAELGLTGEQVRAAGRAELQARPAVARALAEASRKLSGYRATLLAAYGGQLRLRTYAVAALGFERLIGVELEP